MPIRSPRAALTLACMLLGCQSHDPALVAELERPESPPETGADSGTEDRDEPTEDEPTEVEIDLSEHGMAAFVRAPEHAAVRATADEVEVVGGPSYHLLVGRGSVDVLGEQARIVRAFGSEFRRFLRDDGSVLLYETGPDDERHYHLFMTAKTHGQDYHCRTPPEGLPDERAVEHLAEVCAAVRFES